MTSFKTSEPSIADHVLCPHRRNLESPSNLSNFVSPDNAFTLPHWPTTHSFATKLSPFQTLLYRPAIGN